MINYKFRAPPDITIGELPFELNKRAFTEWLSNLSFNNDCFSTCNKLYAVLKLLDRAELDLKLEFAFLHVIVPTVDDLAERLEFSYIDSSFPLTEQELANVEILGWTYMHLATRFSSLYRQIEAEGERWTATDRSDTLYRSFYAAGRMQLYASEVYTQVHDGFWQELFRNYLRAEKLNLFNHRLSEGGHDSPTINAVFKQILIFDICDTNCFRSREIKNLYGLLKLFSDNAVISNQPPEKQAFGIFQFNLDSDQNPKRWTLGIPVGDRLCRYIDVVPVAKNLYKSLEQMKNGQNTLQSINKELLLKVVSMLSQRQKRKSFRFSTQGNVEGFIGFNNAVSIIAKAHGKKLDKLVQVPMHDPRIAGRWKEPDFDLVPIGEEFEQRMYQKQRAGEIVDAKIAKFIQAGGRLKSKTTNWADANDDRNRLMEAVSIGYFDVYSSSIKGYGFVWRAGAQKVKIGEIFGVEQDQGKRHEIGLVRRIAIHSDQTLRLGIELIGMESDMVWLVRAGINKSKGMLAIFIPEIAVLKQPDSIIVADTQLNSGQMINVYQDGNEVSCKLGDLLHSTPAVKHFVLIYDTVV